MQSPDFGTQNAVWNINTTARYKDGKADTKWSEQQHRGSLSLPSHKVLHQLQDPCLFKQWAYIAGKWQQADAAEDMVVTNPADGTRLGTVPRLGAAETLRAIVAAEKAFPLWRDLLPQKRAAYLRAWGRQMLENKDDLALIMTLEQGKPLKEALSEIEYAAEFLDWFAEEARRINGAVIEGHLPDRQMLAKRRPVGVTAAITPWNFPSAMITRKAGAALAAGCTMVVRPASETPFSALALAELADRVGIPPGVFSVLPGNRDIVGVFCSNPAIKAISFTGSTEVGRVLLSQSAQTVKKMVMELGGHAPFIVFSDADIDEAVDGAIAAKFQTSGQDCLAANRIYVQKDICEPFCEKFTSKVSRLRVGNGLDHHIDIGPLMNFKAIDKCQSHVDDAVGKGARLLFGGKRHRAGELFFTPTVLADVSPEMRIYREETFGPVAAIVPFNDEKELMDCVNHSELGLIAYLFTHDHDRLCRLTDVLEYGMVAVNCVKITGGPIPFGGIKQSGLGREGGPWGVDEFLETKYICSLYKRLT